MVVVRRNLFFKVDLGHPDGRQLSTAELAMYGFPHLISLYHESTLSLIIAGAQLMMMILFSTIVAFWILEYVFNTSTRQFEKIYLAAATAQVPPLGALTTEHRDIWTSVRQNLLLSNRQNAASLDVIERAAFLVCLDESTPVTKEEISRACWHGDGRNRFFDKSLQFIVFDNGRAGFNGEHSMMDATPTSRICEFICEGYRFILN